MYRKKRGSSRSQSRSNFHIYNSFIWLFYQYTRPVSFLSTFSSILHLFLPCLSPHSLHAASMWVEDSTTPTANSIINPHSVQCMGNVKSVKLSIQTQFIVERVDYMSVIWRSSGGMSGVICVSKIRLLTANSTLKQTRWIRCTTFQ